MRHQEGLKVSLLEEGMLDSSGILTSNDGCAAAYGLSPEAVQIFLLVALAGEGGLPQSKLPKNLREDLKTHLLPLEMQSLVDWERDGRGRPAYLVLTWRGEEALQAARTAPSKPSSWAAKRKAAVSH